MLSQETPPIGIRVEDWAATPEERAVLSAHVLATYRLREDNVEEIECRKKEFFFKPFQGFAGRGVLTRAEVGWSRLHRLLKKGGYITQKKVPKPLLRGEGMPESTLLWTDLRVWGVSW
jgi:hypothetical protein